MFSLLPLTVLFLLSTVITALPAKADGMCQLKPAQKPVSAVPSGSNSHGNGTNDEFVAMSWYAGWHASDNPPQNISWDKYTQVTYAFAVTTPDPNTISLADSDEQILPTFVSLAHQNGVKASLSIGGWTGSQYYSTNVATESNRTALVNAVLGLVKKYDLDGIDFDWEYPNRQGIGCNILSSSDTSNFLAFLQALRAEPAGANLTLTAAVGLTPFLGPDGNPLVDVSQFKSVIDYITVMVYDIWGTWTPSGVGPNAPLNDTCAPSGAQQGSAVRAIGAWTSALFPSNQILLGVPSYGHSFSVSKSDAFAPNSNSQQLVAYPPFNAAEQPAGDKWDSVAGQTDACGNPTVVGGIWDFWGLVQGGFLNETGDVNTAGGMVGRFDDCSQTPFVYNPTTQVMVSYDDARSFAAKGNFILEQDLGGFAMWQSGGDSNDILLDAIRGAIAEDANEGDC